MNRLPKRQRTANLFIPFRRRRERTGWRGRVYGWFDRIAPATRCAPVRRAVQLVCLAMFLYAFFYVCWPYAERFGATTFSDKQHYPVHLFLLMDPLVGVSTAVAGRLLNVATLWWTVAVLAFCVVVPRAFCGYVCPLGTLIDGFDWLIGRRFERGGRAASAVRRPWVHAKYYVLAGVLMASACGVLASGFVSAIPVLTRGLLFTAARAHLALVKGPHHLAPAGWSLYVSVVLFALVFLLSVLGRRFWCRYVCPSGALLSLLYGIQIGRRQVERTCVQCNRCVAICPFDAIREDFTTRLDQCTYCQTCGGVCAPRAIKFVTRWNRADLAVSREASTAARPVSRRGFLAGAALGGAFASVCRAENLLRHRPRPLRPPGSVPEDRFLDLCIRCGECFKVCPGPVLHPAGIEYGWESLWTPVARPELAGCHQDCNHCTQVCPTGALQPLALPVKRRVHMGLARVDKAACLPFRQDGRQDCDLCARECQQAGYDAIQMRRVAIPLEPPPPEGMFSELELDAMSHIRVPLVDPVKCVGCGICQYRCHMQYVVGEKRLEHSAILVYAENEHRLTTYPSSGDELPEPGERLVRLGRRNGFAKSRGFIGKTRS